MMEVGNIAEQPTGLLTALPSVDREAVDRDLNRELEDFHRKIVVLDDDPTGIQTVHGISVYTGWSEDDLAEAFEEPGSLFFILTNSRGFHAALAEQVNREAAASIVSAAHRAGKDFLVISRGDSTLRGHYPLETQVLKDSLESLTEKRYDGEIILPFFQEGGRYTVGNVHYVKEMGRLVPAGDTEFARDKTFGYHSSHLGEWCEEKTGGAFQAENMVYLSIEELRTLPYDALAARLEKAAGFNKVIVNAVDYVDVKIFCIALIRAIQHGKEFLIRSAAAVTKVLGGIPDRPLLGNAELVRPGDPNGGIVLVGSHVNKTTRQLEELRKSSLPIRMIEFNQHLILSKDGLLPEVERVVALAEEEILCGRSVAVYTRRDRFDLNTDDKALQLELSVKISDAVTSIIAKLNTRPSFIVAKGGITSSDVGTKALRVRRATVMGQIRPGIPVWMTGEESKFPNTPYVIFPGNVGEDTTLREVVETLMSRDVAQPRSAEP